MSVNIKFYCDENKTKRLIPLIMSIIMFVLCILLYGKEFFHISRGNTPIMKSIYVPYLITFICWVVWSSLNIGFGILTNTHECNKYSNIIQFKDAFILSLFNFALGNTYLLYLHRLKFAFRYTDFAITKTVLYILYSMYMVQITSGIVQLISGMIFYTQIYDRESLLSKIYEYTQPISLMTYIISSTILAILFIKKTVKLAKNKPPTDYPSILRLSNAVKYLNCVLVTLISTLICFTVLYFRTLNNNDVFDMLLQCYVILHFDAYINVFFLHLQFSWMKLCYILLCNPFRLEINNELNKHLSKIVLSYKASDSSSSDEMISLKQEKSSTTPSGMEPTNSDNIVRHAMQLEPISQSSIDESDGIKKRRYIYFCILCPITTS